MRRLLYVAVAWMCLAPTNLFAGRPLLSLLRNHGNQPLISRGWRPSTTNYYANYYSLHARYPRYTGAFHYSFFRDLGVPPGDVGLRGNGIYAHPW